MSGRVHIFTIIQRTGVCGRRGRVIGVKSPEGGFGVCGGRVRVVGVGVVGLDSVEGFHRAVGLRDGVIVDGPRLTDGLPIKPPARLTPPVLLVLHLVVAASVGP